MSHAHRSARRHIAEATTEGQMLPIVATPLPKMLPFKFLPLSHVTDVATFPTSYINNARPQSSIIAFAFWKAIEAYRRPPEAG